MSPLTQYLLAFLAIVIVPIYIYYTRYSKLLKFVRQFPNPPVIPLLGNALDFKTPGEFLKKLHVYTKTYGPVFHLQFGLRHSLVISDYKFLEFLLSHNSLLRKNANIKFLKPWIGDGLITADGGPRWRMHRKLITPAFHFKILEQFVDVFEADGDILIEKLSKESGNKSVDIYPYVTRCALDAICETAMGTKINVQTNQTSSYFESARHMCRLFVTRSTSILGRYDFFFRFTNDYKVQEKSVKILHDYTKEVIQNKRRELTNKHSDNNTVDNTDELGRKRKKAFLDLILEAKVDNQTLTDEEIREEVDTFMFAGHDTTATSSSFILYCIANNKEVQEKILEEQRDIFGEEKNPKVTYANLQEMKYLENVVKEGLRLYTPVPISGRLIEQDVEYNGQIIPKGMNVGIFFHGIHMNPEYYPNPEKFDPSRFEVVGNKLPFAFIPFSAGPRNCIGQKYAMVEIKSIVSKVLRNFELSPAFPRHDLDLTPETVLKSLNGVRIGLKLR
ncbi:cytochrome P450 4d2-like [Zophobas morio]|uniref:cytochrome P450 4d2-like n=1 Tax=Zophobas morio TaxID=2755281 RepID=UPI003082F665